MVPRWESNPHERYRLTVLAFEKNTGRSPSDLVEAEPDYLAWMLSKGFAAEVQDILRVALRGEFPRQGEVPNDRID